jgi:hypothetical protein
MVKILGLVLNFLRSLDGWLQLGILACACPRLRLVWCRELVELRVCLDVSVASKLLGWR